MGSFVKKSDKDSSTRLAQNSCKNYVKELENTFRETNESDVKFSSAFLHFFPQVQENLPRSSPREVRTPCQNLVT